MHFDTWPPLVMPDYDAIATRYQVSSRTARRWEDAGIDIENPSAVGRHLANQRTASPAVLAATMNALPPGVETVRKMIRSRIAELDASIRAEKLKAERLKSSLAVNRAKISTIESARKSAPSPVSLIAQLGKLQGAERSSFYQANERAIKRERLLAANPSTITTN